MSVVESTLDGRYQVIARIASGGMGEVYRAHDPVLGREVAVKILHPQLAGDGGFVARFRSEARAAALLNHPNIVGIHDWGSTDGTYYMVMEYVRGTNLRAVLLENGRLEPAQVAEICLQVLAALEHAHAHGIVHRDVKPENILIAEDGTVKVADFGLARAFADSTVSQAEGTVTGTVQYLAPEQIQGERADPRTDLYALGIVMFELLTAQPPYTGETSMAIAYKHLSGTIPAPSSVVPTLEPALDGPVLAATARRRSDRPASARALAGELRRARAGLPPARPLTELAAKAPVTDAVSKDRAATVTIPRAPSRRERRRGRLRRAVVALTLLLALAGAGWAGWVYLVPHYTTVPSVAGLSVRLAGARLQAAGLEPVIADAVFSAKVEAGMVVRTVPGDGTRMRRGARVTIVSSKGPQLLPVPDMRGRPLDEARRLLARAGFGHRVEEAFSDTVPKGHVVAQSPDPGTKLERNSKVTLTVSLGPELVQVPDVRGQPTEVAKGTLQGLGFVVRVVEEFSTEVARDEAIGTDPAAGTSVPKGSEVVLVVSKGPGPSPCRTCSDCPPARRPGAWRRSAFG